MIIVTQKPHSHKNTNIHYAVASHFWLDYQTKVLPVDILSIG